MNDDAEKASAFMGMCKIVRLNPGALLQDMECLFLLFDSIARCASTGKYCFVPFCSRVRRFWVRGFVYPKLI